MASIKEMFKKIVALFNNRKRLPPAKEEIKEFSNESISKKEVIEMQKDVNKNSFKEEIVKQAQVSKLSPNRYTSTEDLCMGMLEDMGLSEEFKKNPRAKKDLFGLVTDLVREDKNLNKLINGRDGLYIDKEEDVKKVQDLLKEKGVKVTSDAVEYLVCPKERPSNPYTHQYENFFNADYFNYRIKDGVYQKSEIYAITCVQSDKVGIRAENKIYSNDGIEMEQNIIYYDNKAFDIKSPDTATYDQYRSAMIDEMSLYVVDPVENAFRTGLSLNGKRTQISRVNLDEVNVTYRNGIEPARSMTDLNRTDGDLADLTVRDISMRSLVKNNEEELKLIEAEKNKRHFERKGTVNGKSEFKESIAKRIKNSRFKEGLTKMASKEGILEQESQEISE